jgi:hypothetical protein
VVCLHGVFISDAHALAVLPNIAHFALYKELASTFIIVTYERENDVRIYVLKGWMADM